MKKYTLLFFTLFISIILVAQETENLPDRVENLMSSQMIALVINFVDLLTQDLAAIIETMIQAGDLGCERCK